MKKFIFAVSMILALVVAVGCSGGVKYSDMIPNPEEIFPNAEINITDGDDGKAYVLNVKNFTEEEYDTFISKCEETNFPTVDYKITNDGGKMFRAYSSDDKYCVDVSWGFVNPDLGINESVLYIICYEKQSD